MRRIALVLTAGLWMGSLLPAHAQSDWTPTKFDFVPLGQRAEKVFRTFKDVTLQATLKFMCFPFPADPSGRGRGLDYVNCYFWSPTKFQIEYHVAASRKDIAGVPRPEWIISDGTGIVRQGSEVGKQAAFNPKSNLFNIASDAALVEAWPSRFPKLMFSSFVGGNATLTRYLAALKRGVGRYQVQTYQRTIRVNGQSITERRIVATRSMLGDSPASTVDIIFRVGAPFLPTEIHTTYGPLWELDWGAKWNNNQPKNKMPKNPREIGNVKGGN